MIEILNKTIRFGGAQIPVTPDIQKNIKTIKKAIDWAAENKVDYLVTPEASLSGYSTTWCDNVEVLADSLKEIEVYAALMNVGLCLGTLWIESEYEKDNTLKEIKRNQLRFYTADGKFIGVINKTVTTPHDQLLGLVDSVNLTGILLTFEKIHIPISAFICADLYGFNSGRGGLPEQLYDSGAKLFLHPTNAERGLDPLRDEIEEMWIESWIRRVSFKLRPIISVDNSCTMTGEHYDGKTMTQSGVCAGGVWVNTVPRLGEQYFYHDFVLNDLILERNPY